MKVFVIKVLKGKTMNISSENKLEGSRTICDNLKYGTLCRSGSALTQLDHGQHVSDQISVLRATETVRTGVGNLQAFKGQVNLKVVASERAIPGFL